MCLSRPTFGLWLLLLSLCVVVNKHSSVAGSGYSSYCKSDCSVRVYLSVLCGHDPIPLQACAHPGPLYCPHHCINNYVNTYLCKHSVHHLPFVTPTGRHC